MSIYTLLTRRPATLAGVFFFVFLLVLFSTSSSDRGSPPAPVTVADPIQEAAPPTNNDQNLADSPLEYPPEYLVTPVEQPYCAERFGLAYLENLRNSATEYCSPDSPSALTCFHSKITSGRVDSFCLGRNAVYDPSTHKFRLGCEHKDPEASASAPALSRFPSYMFETGPKVIFNNWVDISKAAVDKPSTEPRNYTILVKREIEHNVWHGLLEIFSMTMSMDVLRLGSKNPLVSSEDAPNTRVVFLDEHPDGPLFELWNMIGNQPAVRLKDVADVADLQNIIVPLAGGSNPLWQGDWKIHSCEDSKLLRTFSRRVLDFYKLPADRQPRQGEKLKLTFLERTTTRRLVKAREYLDEITSLYAHVDVQSHDFAMIPLQRQLEIIQETDILVGVHGAGLTHSFFLPPRSAVVEILPTKLDYKGFRNVASLLDLSYFSTHGVSVGAPKKRADKEWQEKDVFLDKDKFMSLVDSAIKSMYNRGERSYDAI